MDKEVEFLIEGDNISLIQRRVIKTVSLEAFSNSMATSGWSTGVMPVGCRISGKSSDGLSHYFVIERPPMMTRVDILGAGTYSVHTGFVQFWLVFPEKGLLPSGKFVTTTKQPLRSLQDTVYYFPWPNVYKETSNICTGTQSFSGNTKEEVCSDFPRAFFGARFNFDLTVEFPSVLGGGTSIPNSFAKWDELSKKNPMLGISQDMDYSATGTVGSFLAKVTREVRHVR